MAIRKQLLLALVLALATACNRQPVPRAQTTLTQTETATSVANSTPAADKESFQPKDGYVPDERTAISIAVAVWAPIYGKDQIENEKPFHATLKGGVWTVTGSLPEGRDGGTALAEIGQQDGRILRVIHYQ